MPSDLRITALGEREIVISRSFDAPRQMVFDAHTRPELIQRWLGVFGKWSMAECEVDLRVGGGYRYLWRGTGGQEMGMHGVYREIAAPERIVATEVFDDPWYPGEGVGTSVFEERDGRTHLTSTVRYDSREIRDGVIASPMESGLSASYDKLEVMVAAPAEAR
jgi:uncharacterized protein YndB with AHSA1/START domain